MRDHVQEFKVLAEDDATGEPEEISWDLFPLVDSNATLHLDQDGLAKVGTKMEPGLPSVSKANSVGDGGT
jgi:DNA-directed RNA polymerase beta subunit